MTKKVTIMRAPSGGGKGTYIKANLLPATVVSADDYFMVETDLPHPAATPDNPIRLKEYRFNPALIGLAHNDCFNRFLKALAAGDEHIIVDNTNTHLWEFQNYIVAAEMMGYEVQVIALRAFSVDDIIMCAQRNAHRTPIEVVAKMAYEFEPYEGETTIPLSRGEEQSKTEREKWLEFLIHRVLNDLPMSRDWLDPQIEKAMRSIKKD
jgi:predicted kinase